MGDNPYIEVAQRRQNIVTALIIDSDPESRARLSYSIGGEIPVLNASNVAEGVSIAKQCCPDIIVANGLGESTTSVKELRTHERITGTPLLLLSEESWESAYNPGNSTTPLLRAVRERLKYSASPSAIPASQKA